MEIADKTITQLAKLAHDAEDAGDDVTIGEINAELTRRAPGAATEFQSLYMSLWKTRPDQIAAAADEYRAKKLLETATKEELLSIFDRLRRHRFIPPQDLQNHLLDCRLERVDGEQRRLLREMQSLAGKGHHDRFSKVSANLDKVNEEHSRLVALRYPKQR